MIDGNDRPKRIALYMRVSSDEQAEKGTIQNQRDFLRNFANLYGLNVVASYEDPGVSGTIALGKRPDGRRLLEAAASGHFDELIVYRLDRLGRSLKVLMDAHNTLDAAGVTMRSATE